MSNLSSVCLRNQRIILSKAFTIKFYAPPLASNVLQHHQWPRITTADNNNSRRILILISLYCSSMLATISQLPEEQIATKRRCFVVKHTLSFDFSSLVAMAEEAHRLYRQRGVRWGGFRIGSQMSLSKITATSPFLTPTHTIRRLC